MIVRDSSAGKEEKNDTGTRSGSVKQEMERWVRAGRGVVVRGPRQVEELSERWRSKGNESIENNIMTATSILSEIKSATLEGQPLTTPIAPSS